MRKAAFRKTGVLMLCVAGHVGCALNVSDCAACLAVSCFGCVVSVWDIVMTCRQSD